jgi:hypothetical protein
MSEACGTGEKWEKASRIMLGDLSRNVNHFLRDCRGTRPQDIRLSPQI